MKKQFLLLTVLLFLLGACAPKPAEHSFIKVNADGQFVRDGKPYYFVGTNFWYGAILGSEGEDSVESPYDAASRTLYGNG
jgi:mannan endo-1,4-beta-mannosidase